jgi:predicted nucleotidyltransferase
VNLPANYPTPEHQAAAETVTHFFSANYPVEAVLLVNSCARGKATPDSCLDMNVLVRPEQLKSLYHQLETGWAEFEKSDPVFRALEGAGKYAQVHLDFIDGAFAPQERDFTSGPDGFELGIGNALAYSLPLWLGSDYYAGLKVKWLPYYSEELRTERLKMVRYYCLNNLHHIPLYAARGLYFQSFDRLYNAYREFLQALFIARRTYPIAYDKWIHEQVAEILGLPALYRQLTHLLEIRHFESPEIAEKARQVEDLLEQYAPQPAG